MTTLCLVDQGGMCDENVEVCHHDRGRPVALARVYSLG